MDCALWEDAYTREGVSRDVGTSLLKRGTTTRSRHRPLRERAETLASSEADPVGGDVPAACSEIKYINHIIHLDLHALAYFYFTHRSQRIRIARVPSNAVRA